LVVRLILSLILFFFIFLPSSDPSAADDKNTIPLKKLFNVAKIDFNKKIAGHSATLLSDGRLLIIGGRDDTGPLSSIVKYEPSTNQLKESIAKLIAPRSDHTATMLSDGKVLITGGSDSAGPLSSAEVYDPLTDAITSLSSALSIPRSGHSATLLSDGRVLITGGVDSSGISLDSAEVYDPKTQSFSAISAKMTIARSNHSATLMPDGRVIIIGGKEEGQGSGAKAALNSVEVYNTATETFTPLSGVLKKGRFGHTATLLPDGRILIALGAGSDYDEDDDDDDKDISKIKPYNNAELYDPVTDTFIKIAGKLTDKRYDHTANLLTDAGILIIGGQGKKEEWEKKENKISGVLLTPVIKDTIIPLISSITINNNPPNPNTLTLDPLALIRFSEPIRVTTLNSDTLILKKGDGTKTEGIISQSESGLLTFFTPKNPLSGGKGYTIELTSNILDTSGNPLTAYTNTFTVPNPIPAITSINPTTAFANTSFNLTIKGTGIVETSQLKLGGYAIPTTYKNETELTGAVPSTAIKTPGNYPVTIENQSPGGGQSNAINLEIKAAINIQITSPPDNITVSTPYVTIEGSIFSTYPISEIKVWGLPANTTGNAFSAPVIIAPNANTITVTARDSIGNQATALINITLQETPPPTGQQIKGWIHGQAYDAITKSPLSDAEIIAKGLTYKVHTDANGKYTYPVPEEGGYQLYIEKAGYVTSMRQAYVIIQRETMAEPAYLIPFDTKAVVIRAAAGGTLTDTTGMVEVIIPPNALPYDMPISATYMPTEESFPIPIPYGDNYIAGVQFTPEYVTFNQPVTVRLRNTLGFAPGTQIPYAYAAHDIEDQNTGFYDPGMGVVTSDGAYIEYQLPHFSCMASTLPGPPDNPPGVDGGGCQGCKCGGVGGSCTVLAESGDLLIDHFLPPYKLLGQEEGLTLLYDSNTVYQYVPIRVKAKPRPNSARPDLFKLNASFGGGGGGGGISVDFLGVDVEQDFRLLMMQEISSRPSMTTGVYYPNIVASQKFGSTVFYRTDIFGGRATVPTNVTNPKPVVSSTKTSYGIPINNQIDSPFGAGWTISGYERLHINPDGNILLTDGTSSLIFKQSWSVQPAITGLRSPRGIVIDSQGKIFVADHTDGGIFYVEPVTGNVTLFAKIAGQLKGLAIDKTDNIYAVAGSAVYKVTPLGVVTTYARVPMGHLEDMVMDNQGNLYVINGNPGVLFKVFPNGSVTEHARGFVNPISLAVDKDDNIYVSNDNNTWGNIRCGTSYISKVDTAGNVSTYISDINQPRGITIDASGDMYYVDATCDGKDEHHLYRFKSNGLKEKLADRSIGSSKNYCLVFGLAFDIAMNSNGDIYIASTDTGAIFTMNISSPTQRYISPEGDYSILTKESDGTFNRRLKDGTTIRYNAQGLMTSKTDRNGNTYAYTHNTENKLTAITDPLNQTTTLNYSGGFLSSITDPFGRTTTFAHNGKNLTAITGSDGATTQYSYDDRRLLTTKTLPGNKTYQYTYDQYGKIRTTQAPTGETRQYLPAAVQKLINDIPAGTGTPDNPAEPPLAADIKSQVTDGKGYTRYIKTDKTGVIEKTEALGRITTYTRDINGNPLQITLPDGNTIRMSYDAKGNLLSRTDQLNNATTFTYEPIYNMVSSIRDPKWNTTRFNYDINGNLITITDALNNATGITYNNKGLITSITDAQNNITQYTYNALYQLETITDALNNTTRFTYDSRSNITSITDAKGNITAYEYDILDRLIKVTDPAGNVTTYTYDAGARCDCGKENPNGNITSITDANGNTTTFEYNSIGQLTKITDPINNIKTYSYDMNRNLISITDAKGSTIAYDYDPANRLIKKVMPEGSTDYAYDLMDNLTTAQNPDVTYNMGYDIAGRNTAVTNSFGKTLNYSYDQNSNRTGITTGTTYRYYNYDQLNRLISGFNAYTYDSLNRRTRMTIYGVYGRRIDLNYTYDQLSRLTRILDQNSSLTTTYADINYTYDENSNRTSAISAAQITSPSRITSTSSITTDIPNIEITGSIDNPAGSAVQINNSPITINPDNTFNVPLGLTVGDNTINIKLTDVLGRETTKDMLINLTSDIPGTIDIPSEIMVKTPLLKIAGTISNPAGYIIRINGIDIPITNNQFESIQNLQWGQNTITIQVTNPSGQILTKQITATYDPAGGNLYANYIAIHPITNEVYAIDYYQNLRITKITPDGAITPVYTFPPDYYYANAIAFSPSGELYISGQDILGDNIQKLNTDGTTTTIISGAGIYPNYLSIDANNNIYANSGGIPASIYRITPDGQITLITHLTAEGGITTIDASGNIYASISNIIYKIAPDGAETILYQRPEASSIGSITSDNNGSIYGITIENATVNRCSGYNIIKIDSAGSVTTLLPAPADVCDDGIRADSGIGLSSNDIIITGKWGQRILKITQAGIITDYIQPQEGEEPLNIMVNVADLSLSIKVPVNIRATRYIYGAKTYSYDNLSRLTGVMKGVLEDESYSYDTVGNRLSDIARNTYSYNSSNELLNYDGVSFQYDANGNIVSKTDSSSTTSYVYDSENRLIELRTPNAQLITYKYDPFGRRIEKNVNGVITRYVYDREDILYELDASGNVITEYVHGPGIDEPIAMLRNNQTYYYHADGLGSIIAITNSAGQVVQRYEYDSFGQITYTQDATFKQPYTFTGREYDEESGLYYYRARYYDARVGRFVTQDPILSPINPTSVGISQSINKNVWLLPYLKANPKALHSYLYTNNPLTFTDPYGLHTYVPIGNTPQGGTVYGVFDDNGNYTGTITGDRPPIYDVGEACYNIGKPIWQDLIGPIGRFLQNRILTIITNPEEIKKKLEPTPAEARP
jgi:RHS repeat-associated protein